MQVVKNVRRGSVEGLSPLMFMCTVMGNLTYGFGIIIHVRMWLSYGQCFDCRGLGAFSREGPLSSPAAQQCSVQASSWLDITSALPWLVGSLGTLGFDATILIQFWCAVLFACTRRAAPIFPM